MMNDWITEQLERLIRWLDRTFNIVEHNEDDNAYYAWADARLDELAEQATLERAIRKASEIGCIRMHWGARRPCDEYTDGRELCAPCALRVQLAK